MKFQLKGLICALLVGSFLGLGSCGDDHDDLNPSPETPTYPSSPSETPKDYTFSREDSWSAVAYHDVTLAEIHSTVSDYSLSCSAPEGYSIHLKKLASKDDAGYNVYRIVCDMKAITQTTSTDENVKLEIPYTLTGSYISNGTTNIWTTKGNVNLKRFFAPDKEAENKFFPYFWYLSEYEVHSNGEWVTFTSENSYTQDKETTVSYSQDFSPISRKLGREKITGFDMDGNEYEYYTNIPYWSCSISLPGWVESKEFNRIFNGKLVNTRFSFDNYPLDYGCSVYMVTDQIMRCMKAVYSDSGELQQVYRYKFNRYVPEEPEMMENQ